MELGTTQPAVSQKIKRLEVQLDIRPFDHIHLGIVLTVAGQLLQQHVAVGLTGTEEGLRTITTQPAPSGTGRWRSTSPSPPTACCRTYRAPMPPSAAERQPVQ
ncbi:LysR family transcriptional regulator [Pseudomonas oryzihabitans]|uniref:LysR family transcriptional regulator n=1 Tax=Pseudomonas oryzihabitans TaxID=47885 RepID=UPI0034605A3B